MNLIACALFQLIQYFKSEKFKVGKDLKGHVVKLGMVVDTCNPNYSGS
jgi:hypothetical protein